MEELKIKTGELELIVAGEPGTIKEVSKEFYNHLAAREQKETEARMALDEKMREKMAWYAKEYDRKHQAPPAEKQEETVSASGNATLRAVWTSAVSWEELARQIKSGDDLAVGDKVDFQLKTGEKVTVVVTQSTDEYVRFETVDCVGGEYVQWNKENTTNGGIEEANVQKWLQLELFGQLPDDLQQAISKVKRKYKDNEGDLKEYETLLFLPAASEVFDKDYCYSDEGVYEQLDYYKDRRHRMRGAAKGENTVWYWLASVNHGNSKYACSVSDSGLAGYNGASNGFLVPFCFCISKS